MGRLTRRFRGVVRREAQDLLRGGPPTADLLRPVGPTVPTDAQVQQVLDVCMRVGEVLLGSGEPAEDTSDTMLRMAAALGLPTVDIDITFNSITMCCHRGMVAAPLTTMRLVRYRTTDLTRLAAVTRIVARVEREGLSVYRAAEELAAAVAANHPYPRWVATLGWAGQAGAVAVLLGGAPVIAATAFVVTALIDRLGRLLGRFGAAPFFLQLVGAMVATVSTLALFGVGALPAGTDPSLVIAAGITVLLSGLSVVGTVQDAISGYYVTAAGRAAEVALLSAGLLTGVVLGLKLGMRSRSPWTRPRRCPPTSAGSGSRRSPQAPRRPCTPWPATRRCARSSLQAWRAGWAGRCTGRSPSSPTSGRWCRPGWRPPSSGSPPGSRGAAPACTRTSSCWRGSSHCCRASPRTAASTSWPSRAWWTASSRCLLALAIGLALAAGVALGNFVSRPRTTSAVVESD